MTREASSALQGAMERMEELMEEIAAGFASSRDSDTIDPGDIDAASDFVGSAVADHLDKDDDDDNAA